MERARRHDHDVGDVSAPGQFPPGVVDGLRRHLHPAVGKLVDPDCLRHRHDLDVAGSLGAGEVRPIERELRAGVRSVQVLADGHGRRAAAVELFPDAIPVDGEVVPGRLQPGVGHRIQPCPSTTPLRPGQQVIRERRNPGLGHRQRKPDRVHLVVSDGVRVQLLPFAPPGLDGKRSEGQRAAAHPGAKHGIGAVSVNAIDEARVALDGGNASELVDARMVREPRNASIGCHEQRERIVAAFGVPSATTLEDGGPVSGASQAQCRDATAESRADDHRRSRLGGAPDAATGMAFGFFFGPGVSACGRKRGRGRRSGDCGAPEEAAPADPPAFRLIV